MNDPNRRQHKRSEVDHPAILRYGGSTLSDCRIRNYSTGGLYLEYAEAETHSGEKEGAAVGGIKQHSHALIEIPVTEDSGSPIISIAVKTAFASRTGVGVAFLEEEKELLDYLQQFSAARTAASPSAMITQVSGQQKVVIFQDIHSISHNFLARTLPGFFSRVKDALITSADQEKLNNEQVELFYAISMLEKEHQSISDSLFRLLDTDILTQRDKTEEQRRVKQGMELVDKDDFDEWVHIIDLARSTESKVRNPLYQIEKLLTRLTRRPIGSENNPLSPQYFLWSLRNTLQPLGLGVGARKVIYRSFHDQVLSCIGDLYQELNDNFDRQGIKNDGVTSIQPRSKQGESRIASKPARSQKKKSVLGSLSSMMHVEQEGGERKPDSPAASRDQVIDFLDQIPVYSGHPVSERIARYLGRVGNGDATTIDSDIRETIDATEQLISTFREDEWLSGDMQQLINRLEIPMIKETIRNPALLDDADHPLRQLLERLDQLAPYTTLESASGQDNGNLSSLMDQISDAAGGGDPAAIATATRKVESLLTWKKKKFNDNLAMVIESSNQGDLLLQAREKVKAELKKMLLKGPYPAAVERLLRLGWPGLLVQCQMGKERDRIRSRVYSKAIRFLGMAFDPTHETRPIQPQKLADLTKVLARGFTEYPVHLPDAGAFLEELREALQKGEEAYERLREGPSSVDEAFLDQFLEEQMPSPSLDATATAAEGGWLKLVSGIEKGEWIVEKLKQGQVRLLQLGWKNPASSWYVFVDGNGDKMLETGINELANLFAEQQFSLLENRELPLVERAVERLLKKSFNQVSQESTSDELTGLMNRKAFERKVKELIEQTAAKGGHHALIQLDVDQFTMINNLCGFEGGDRLLKTITHTIRAYLTPDATLARTGDDEFGILLEHTVLEGAFQVAESLRRVLENLKFSWQNHSAPVTASSGIVAIDNTSETAGGLLAAAASACHMAKQAGRNCSRIYRSGEQAFREERRLIKSIPFIEEALEKNRLNLNCQLITPLFIGEEMDHYEVLLRVLDENNQPTNPVDFIQAAERYDRMRSVDRWVVNRFFSWVKNHRHELPDTVGFTLNLSGQSVVDESFWDFLKQHINDCSLPSESLGFEITETALVKNMNSVTRHMQEVREMGCTFYLDDFGSGYASYSYLKQLPVDYIKIDGIFVRDILEEKSSLLMVKSITEIAHFMDKKVIAEFVENDEVITALRELNVDLAQGYGVGRPRLIDNILENARAYG